MSLCETSSASSQTFRIKGLAVALNGAGRGSRTPMELPPTDFEFPNNTVNL
jgi:hypothetical protein